MVAHPRNRNAPKWVPLLFVVKKARQQEAADVGEEGQPLSSYDFPSDDNPNKERARGL